MAIRANQAGRLSVLRLCSVFEPPPDLRLSAVARFDPIGGMQSHTAALTRALDRLGVRQVVVTARPPGAPPRQRLASHAEVIRLGWPVPWLRQLYAVPAAVAAGRPWPAADIVHVHLGEDLAIVPLGLLAMRARGASLVLTSHCSLTHTFGGTGARALALRSLGGWLERVGVRRAAAVIALTDRTANALRSWVEPDRLHVIPSGVEVRRFKGSAPDPLPHVGRPRAVFVGRLVEQKGVSRLIDAIPQLASQARVVLVGDGPHRRALEDQVRSRGLDGRVTITGFVHPTQVPAHLLHADVLVLPSLYEEFGSVLIEAMAAGLPVVAAARGGIPSLVRHEENGLLWHGDEVRSFARLIDRLLTDRPLRDRVVRGGWATVAQYDWDVLAARVLEVYRRVLEGAADKP